MLSFNMSSSYTFHFPLAGLSCAFPSFASDFWQHQRAEVLWRGAPSLNVQNSIWRKFASFYDPLTPGMIFEKPAKGLLLLWVLYSTGFCGCLSSLPSQWGACGPRQTTKDFYLSCSHIHGSEGKKSKLRVLDFWKFSLYIRLVTNPYKICYLSICCICSSPSLLFVCLSFGCYFSSAGLILLYLDLLP